MMNEQPFVGSSCGFISADPPYGFWMTRALDSGLVNGAAIIVRHIGNTVIFEQAHAVFFLFSS
jgi:hypothetical protein